MGDQKTFLKEKSDNEVEEIISISEKKQESDSEQGGADVGHCIMSFVGCVCVIILVFGLLGYIIAKESDSRGKYIY